MKAAVIVFPGSNCDRDCRTAIERSTDASVEMVWHAETALPQGLDLIVLPGGFAYGDYLRCGAMAAQSAVMRPLKEAAARGVPVLGICNGFQVLCEAGMLPGRCCATPVLSTSASGWGSTWSTARRASPPPTWASARSR